MQDTPTVDNPMPDDAICLGCGYRLKALSEPRCPECGRRFDPGDKRTYTRPGASSLVRLWMECGPGWFIGSGVILTTGVMLWADSVPQGFFGWYLLGALGVLLFGGSWSLLMLMALIGLALNGRLKQGFKAKWKRWLVPAAVAVVGMGLMELDIPRQARFSAARPGMARLAAQVQQSGNPMHQVWAGGTKFSLVEKVGQSGTVFMIEGSGFMGAGGWAYLPDPADQPTYDWEWVNGYGCKRLEGDWFVVQYDPF